MQVTRVDIREMKNPMRMSKLICANLKSEGKALFIDDLTFDGCESTGKYFSKVNVNIRTL